MCCFYIVFHNIFYANYIMFDFVFRKKPTIFLLLSIIVISLIFSIILNQPIHEGLENDGSTLIDATINNPPLEIVDQAIKILKDENKKTIEKLSEIRGLLKNKYKILGDIYRQNESSLIKELTASLSVPAKKDNDGKLFDENAVDGDKRITANKILSSSDYSAMEKIEKIKEIVGKDRLLSNILDEYSEAWLRMVKSNFEKLKLNSNDTLLPTSQ
jgi:hypothetical protein